MKALININQLLFAFLSASNWSMLHTSYPEILGKIYLEIHGIFGWANDLSTNQGFLTSCLKEQEGDANKQGWSPSTNWGIRNQ